MGNATTGSVDDPALRVPMDAGTNDQLSAASPGRKRRAVMALMTIVPSAFVITFAAFLWFQLGPELARGSGAALQPQMTADRFLLPPASDPSVPRSSDVVFKPVDPGVEPAPTY